MQDGEHRNQFDVRGEKHRGRKITNQRPPNVFLGHPETERDTAGGLAKTVLTCASKRQPSLHVRTGIEGPPRKSRTRPPTRRRAATFSERCGDASAVSAVKRNTDPRIVEIKHGPVYDYPPTVEDLFQEAAHNHAMSAWPASPARSRPVFRRGHPHPSRPRSRTTRPRPCLHAETELLMRDWTTLHGSTDQRERLGGRRLPVPRVCWCARRDLNPRPTGSKPAALSS